MEKNDCDIWNQHSRICKNVKHCAKQKDKINFGTKMAFFGYFGLYVLKSIVIFEISISEFVKMPSFVHY